MAQMEFLEEIPLTPFEKGGNFAEMEDLMAEFACVCPALARV